MEENILSIPDIVRDRLISMDGEIRQLQNDLNREKGLNKLNQEELQELEEDNRSLRAKLSSASSFNVDANTLKDHIERLKEENASLLQEMENANSTNEQQLLELQAAQKQIEILQLPSALSDELVEKPISGYELELLDLNSQLRNDLMDLKADFASQLEVNNLLREQIKEQLETIEHLEGNFGEVKRLLRESNEQKRNLEIELQDARSVEMAKSGNSIFAEFDDMRKKNENDLKKVFCENMSLKRHILMLNTELEELRMLGGKGGVVVEVRGRCICEDQRFEVIKLRSEVQKFRQKYLTSVQTQRTLMSDYLKRSKGPYDASMRAQITTLECNYAHVMNEFDLKCTQNNSLQDKAVELTSKLRRSEREVQAVTQELELMKKRLQIAANRKQHEEAPEDEEKPLNDIVLSTILRVPEVESQPVPILRAPRIPLSTPARPSAIGLFKQPMSLASATKNEHFFQNGAEAIKKLSFSEHADDFESGRRMTLTNAEKRRMTSAKKKVEPKVKAQVSKTIVFKNGTKSVVNHNTAEKKAFAPSALADVKPVSGSILGQPVSVNPCNDTMSLFGKGELNIPISCSTSSEKMITTKATEDPTNVSCHEEFNMDLSSLNISQSINRNPLSSVKTNARTTANEDFFTSFNKERLLASHFSENEEENEV